jgi:hypothetical protein
MHDRLLRLVGCNRVLGFHDIHSVDAYSAGSRALLAQIHHPHRALLYRLVSTGQPEVMVALRPAGDMTWQVAGLTGAPAVWLLSAKRGPLGKVGGERVSMTCAVTDPDGERRA